MAIATGGGSQHGRGATTGGDNDVSRRGIATWMTMPPLRLRLAAAARPPFVSRPHGQALAGGQQECVTEEGMGAANHKYADREDAEATAATTSWPYGARSVTAQCCRCRADPPAIAPHSHPPIPSSTPFTRARIAARLKSDTDWAQTAATPESERASSYPAIRLPQRRRRRRHVQPISSRLHADLAALNVRIASGPQRLVLVELPMKLRRPQTRSVSGRVN